MEGLITQLPNQYNQQVLEIWEDLSRTFHTEKASKTTPIPHFTWHVAQSYAPETMEILQDFFKNHPISPIRTGGLGLFHNDAPVIYLSIHISMSLLRFHKEMIKALQPVIIHGVKLYEPELWTPHITLAMEDTNPQIAGEIIAKYARNRYDWEFMPDNVIQVTETLDGIFIQKDSIHF